MLDKFFIRAILILSIINFLVIPFAIMDVRGGLPWYIPTILLSLSGLVGILFSDYLSRMNK